MSDPNPTAEIGPQPHSRVAKALHWGFILVFLYALTKQLDEVEELEDAALLQNEMVFASIFLALLLARFLYMQFTRPSAMPTTTSVAARRLARTVHVAMYVGLATIAVSGLWIGAMYGAGTKSGPAMDAALLLHEIAVNGSYFLILGHIAAAIYHRRQGDGLWDTMVPLWKESKSPAARTAADE